jgi:hypothetical protein
MANVWNPKFKVGDCIKYNGVEMCIKTINLNNQTYDFVRGGSGTGDYIDNGFERDNGMEGKNIIAPAVLISSATGGRKLRKSKKSRRSKKNRRSSRRSRKY